MIDCEGVKKFSIIHECNLLDYCAIVQYDNDNFIEWINTLM